MKVKVTETVIKATAEELKVSNSLSDAFSMLMRNALNPYRDYVCDEDDEDEEEVTK